MAVGDLQKAVGRYLRAHRLDRGLSQEAFAEELGVHRTYMGGIERGERNLTLRNVERLAEQLGVTIPAVRLGAHWETVRCYFMFIFKYRYATHASCVILRASWQGNLPPLP